METIHSKDGTLIVYEKTGNGPPLILVHGTGTDHMRWKTVVPKLEGKYKVYAVDRRGRGGSGDTQPYSIEREYEDIAAIVDSIPEPVNLLGHSYGALCSLEAAMRTENLNKLILYEPSIRFDGGSFPPEVVREIKSSLEAGDRDGAVAIFLRYIALVSEDEIKLQRSLPAWQGKMALAHTILRELQAPANYRFEPKRLQNIKVPSLLLLGGESPNYRKTAVERLHAALPNSRIAVMPGQQHIAMSTAPELFLRKVFDFLAEPALELEKQ
jgi:pimeloyl-ACP methyl ester carboxylesterase